MQVVYVDVDSLCPDHLGAYGYGPDITLNIDALATDDVCFDHAYAANTPCLPSRAGTISGRFGVHNGVETHGPRSQTLYTPATDVQWAGSWRDRVDDRQW